MKTYNTFLKSELSLEGYLENKLSEGDIPHYDTVHCVNGKYFYLGVLPEFKQ